MARVLWYGDAGSHTGFARVTHAIVPRLIAKGHEVHILALNYPGDWIPEIDGLRLYKANAYDGKDTFGLRRTADLVDRLEPTATILLHDPAAIQQVLFRNPWDHEQKLLNAAPILAYMPVDGYNYPVEMIDVLRQVLNIVVMSRHGQATFPGSKLVYHGVDETDFWPVSPARPIAGLTTKAECKEYLGYPPDAFLVLRVDKNSGRKDIAATIHAVGPLLERHRDMILHLHSSTDPLMPGVIIPVVLGRYDIADGQAVVPDDLDTAMVGWPQYRMNILYNAADVFVSTSRGEGFGLGLAEALSCAVPVVAQNVSAIPEVVGPGGILIEPERALTVPAGHDLWLPNIAAFTEAIEGLYQDRARAQHLGHLGWVHVTESFSWDFAADRFHDFIEGISRWRASQEATNGPS